MQEHLNDTLMTEVQKLLSHVKGNNNQDAELNTKKCQAGEQIQL